MITPNGIHTGGYVINEEGFHRNMGGNRGKPDIWTLSIDEFLVELRTYANNIVEAADEDDEGDSRAARRARAAAQLDANCLATQFRALDDWLSSGRRRLPKSWWTTTTAQEPDGGEGGW